MSFADKCIVSQDGKREIPSKIPFQCSFFCVVVRGGWLIREAYKSSIRFLMFSLVYFGKSLVMVMVRQLWFYLVLLLGSGASQTMNDMTRCERSVGYEELQFILAHSHCARDVPEETYGIRMKRNQDSDTSSHVYALQATIKDHRTIIDDHRTMINYLLNNTVNVTQFNQNFANQHSQTGPMWKSWRDVSLVLLIIYNLFLSIFIIMIRLKPLELLTSFIVRRHQVKVAQKKTKKNVVRALPSDLELDSVSTIDRTHLRY